MKKINIENTIFQVFSTSKFDRQLRKMKKQGKDINKLELIVEKIANKETLDFKYNNHKIIDNKRYKNCFECHVEPDWLLIYKVSDDELILLLFETGSHSELFNK